MQVIFHSLSSYLILRSLRSGCSSSSSLEGRIGVAEPTEGEGEGEGEGETEEETGALRELRGRVVGVGDAGRAGRGGGGAAAGSS